MTIKLVFAVMYWSARGISFASFYEVFFIVFGTIPKVWYFVFHCITLSITVMEAGGLAP
jgi:hypothetical protein